MKLVSKWKESYTITTVLSKKTYRIANENEDLCVLVNRDLLKKYYNREL